jgi:competence protein ComEA
MSTPPKEWRFFGDPPAPETLDAEPESVVPDEIARHQNATLPGLAGLLGRARENPLLLAVAAIIGVCVLALVFVSVAFVSFAGRSGSVVIADRSADVGASESPLARRTRAVETEPVLVDVEGAVVVPGLLHVPAGSRVGDAIVAAGGYSSAVDLDAAAIELNLAATVADGDKLHVPSLAERAAIAARSPATDGGSASVTGALVDLNHADQAALESLPGIGPVTATKIITARSSQPFASLDDAATRKVLSASVVEQIRPLATVTP